MWTAPVVAWILAASAAQNADLDIVNVNFVHGPNGPVRAANRYLPGDVLFLDFHIAGLKFDANGKANYGVGMLVTDSKGETVLKQEPKPQEALNYLGGKILPGSAHLQIGTEQAAGTYTIKITVSDESTKATKTIERKFEVLPPGFGLVQVGLSSDPDALVPETPHGVLGETIFLNFAAVGFERDRTSKQPRVSVALRILDENGQPTLKNPLTGEASSNIPENLKLIPMQFPITLNRVGKFTIELSAQDQLGNKSAVITLPLTVSAGGK